MASFAESPVGVESKWSNTSAADRRCHSSALDFPRMGGGWIIQEAGDRRGDTCTLGEILPGPLPQFQAQLLDLM